jgi:hypothetical protein
MIRMLSLVMILLLGACASRGTPPPGTEADIARLAQAIRQMDARIDPAEAGRAARIAYEHTHALALAYGIEDAPLIHNAKVNRGEKSRGLCWHWAEDMEKRLEAENFRTLDMHRAIANADSRILIDHSTAVISAKGAPMQDGMVLDPWREGGVLFWKTVAEDTRYDWVERSVVLRKYGRIRYVDQAGVPINP